MSSVSAHPAVASVSIGRIGYGILGGLLGGALFGVLMQVTGMIRMVAMLVGSESATVGWLVHLAISAFIGATFALLFGRWATRLVPAAAIGLGYGVFWWILGGLVLMPARLGMDILVLNTAAWQSLLGHLVYGAVLGLVFAVLVRRTAH